MNGQDALAGTKTMIKMSFVMMAMIMASEPVMAEVTITYDTCTIDGVTGARVTSVTGDDKLIEIPSTYNGESVIAIGDGAFKNNTTVLRIVLPETVREIQYNGEKGGAFEGCIALTTCNIPTGVTEISKYCFNGCTQLREIELPARIRYINDCAFMDCTSLETVMFPNGLQWIYYGAFYGCSSLKEAILPDTVVYIGNNAFSYCASLKDVYLQRGVTSIGSRAFIGCDLLREITIPDTVTSLGSLVLNVHSGRPMRVVFLGKPPSGIQNAINFSEFSSITVEYPKQYGALWQAQLGIDKMGGFVKAGKPVVTVLSAAMRHNQLGIMDIVYKVTSIKPTVKVRVLAFKDGVRHFANVIRPETFVNCSGVGDSVTANVVHTLSWDVAADCTNELANLTVEIFAVEDDVLPLELMTIPANGNKKAMEISWNVPSQAQMREALFWYYADHVADLTLTDHVLKHGDKILADIDDGYFSPFEYSVFEYLVSKMGFSVLSGDALEYVNSMTRLGLLPDYCRQYAYRWIDGQ